MIPREGPQNTLMLIDRLDGLVKVLKTVKMAVGSCSDRHEQEAVEWTLFICGQEADDISEHLGLLVERQRK